MNLKYDETYFAFKFNLRRYNKGETDNTRKFPFFGSRVDPYGSLLYTYDAYTTAKIDAGPAPPPPPGPPPLPLGRAVWLVDPRLNPG